MKMRQTEARMILKDAPIMWRRINSIGVILDCNSTYAASLGYAKSEILGRSIFKHVPKESWHDRIWCTSSGSQTPVRAACGIQQPPSLPRSQAASWQK